MRKACILVVEDEVIAAEGVRDRLQSLRYMAPPVVTTGEDAVQKAGELRPALVLMDIKLKGEMDGIEAAEQIRARFDIPVVYLTAYADEATLERARISEPFGYILKPFKAGDLRSTIEMALHKHEMDQKLKESEEWFRALVEDSSDVTTVVTADGTLRYASPSYERLLGYPPDEVTGTDYLDFVHADDLQRVADAFAEILQSPGARAAVEFRFLHKDGSWRWLAFMGSNQLDNRAVAGIVGNSRDVTERVGAEEQVRASLREKEVLLREIHHRVKNNLQVISTLLDFQSKTIEDEQARKAFRESQNRIQSMASVHRYLYQSEDLAQVGMEAYIRGLVADLKQSYGACTIAIEVDASDVMLDIDSAVPCGLLISELVSNAMKHAFPSPGDRTASQADEIRMALRPSPRDGKLELTVSDNGVGLPPDLDLEHAKTLGLRLVSMLTRQLDGALDVECAPGSGTVFKITFPAPKQASKPSEGVRN